MIQPYIRDGLPGITDRIMWHVQNGCAFLCHISVDSDRPAAAYEAACGPRTIIVPAENLYPTYQEAVQAITGGQNA